MKSEEIQPCCKGAQEFANAILDLIEKDKNLIDKIEEFDSRYNGDYNDWIAEEEENWNRAADHLFDFIKKD